VKGHSQHKGPFEKVFNSYYVEHVPPRNERSLVGQIAKPLRPVIGSIEACSTT
jgi:hypothetical protein